jgi:hypothetical protein
MKNSGICQRGSTKGSGENHKRKTFLICGCHQMKDNRMGGTSGRHEHVRNTYINVDDRKPE